MKNEGCKGFVEVIPSNAPSSEAIWGAAIHSGLGPLSPNAILMAWPEDWEKRNNSQELVTTLKGLTNLNKAIMIMKGGANYPCERQRLEGGTIDIWWVVHDGGLLLLLPYLISQHKVWRNKGKLRLFAVLTNPKENPLTVEAALRKHLAEVRIVAEVCTVDLSDTNIAGDMRHVYSKTADMQKRRELLRALENPSTMSQAARHSMAEETGHKTIAEVFSGFGFSERAKATKEAAQASPLAEENKRKDSAKALLASKKLNLDSARMKTAVAFNRCILQHSEGSELVVTNLPLMRSVEHATDFCGYVDVMLEGVKAALLVRGAGQEVVTTYG
jgi:potassium/chloride transporter 4/5/6